MTQTQASDSSGYAISDLPQPIGYVLGGGASLGAVHVGMLEALAEAGVRPDLILGTSVGSLNGALLSEDVDTAPQRLRQAWMMVERGDIFDSNVLHILRQYSSTKTSLVGADGVAAAATAALTATTFAELPVPFGAVTADLKSSRVHVAEEGPLVPALLASCAIPGIFPPVVIDEYLLVDGGILANVPIKEAHDRGAKSIVVLDCTIPTPALSLTAVEGLLTRVNRVQQHQQIETALAGVVDDVPVVYLNTPAGRQVSPLDFDQSEDLMRDALAVTRAQLQSLRIDGPGLYGSSSSRYVGVE
ncbi:patatin-like phospholipase family protein [Ornithinimicrobium sp. Arc0846-15]|nr:patatin-like phospholipase family protein [Ornithinimicrobium laminariae]